ncbi:hypothetical protein JX265_010286 [Neoarthrinium moseri]|uniref:FAD-binding PCMH-type domain-containing protein n=1 Tax=Neoarthrinium moseri TaxID=1658444 RepID=A0A9P9WEU5_9PEZI|nr:hypothetical protein JX265_010286 [Neoarthrinium moseri]
MPSHWLLFVLIGGGNLFTRYSCAKPTTEPTTFPRFRFETDVLTTETLKKYRSKNAHLLAFNTSGPITASGGCKVFPGDAAWPSSDEWNALDDALGGALIKTVPLAAPCYREWEVYNAAKCEAIVANWTNPHTHMEDPTSVMWPVWEGLTCLPVDGTGNSSCTIGGYPTYAVNATTVAHIQLAINFARNSGLRIVIKNTGHDYLGKSSGAGALSIWTHNLKSIEYLPNFGRSSVKAIHAGAGVTSLEVSQIAYGHDASVVAGMCASVGFAGGYFTGGGLSPLSSLFGMAADHILAAGVVTADGQYVIASPESHPDLFWAIRGGGGSTWGVVTSVVVRLHPTIPLTTSAISFQTSANVSNETFWEGARSYFENIERFTSAGFYGFSNTRRLSSFYNNSDFSFALEPMLAPNTTIEAFNRVTKPFFDRLKELGIPYTNEQKFYESFHEGWIATWPDEHLVVTVPTITEGSRLFPRELFTNPEGIENSLQAIRTVSERGYDITGFALAPRNPFHVDNSVNPALRNALGHFSSGVVFAEHSTSEQMAATQAELMNNILDVWREVAPSEKMGGSYLNEANIMEPNWQDDFYGLNYPELLRIKRTYDPYSVFYATTGVGSEDWEVRSMEQGIRTQNGRLCRL